MESRASPTSFKYGANLKLWTILHESRLDMIFGTVMIRSEKLNDRKRFSENQQDPN